MRDIRNDVGILSETIRGIGGAARTMTFAFTVPMVALGTYAVQAASSVDAAMRNINSILGLSETEYQALSARAFEFAKTTRDGVTPAIEALYEVFSAGVLDQDRAIAVWETSTRVAEAGLADLSATTNAVTATMSAFNLETSEASRVGNVWTRMVQLGVGSLDEFLSNSQKVLPLSSALNISLEDMGATLAFLSQGGGGAAKAETSYAMMLSNLLKPATAMEEAFKKLGVVSGNQLIEQFGSVAGAVMALKQATGDVDFSKLFSKTGLEAALRLTNNFEAMGDAVIEFNTNLDTATLDAWAQQSKSFAFQWDLMKTSLEAVAVVIGNAIMPLVTPLVQGFSDFLQNVSDMNPQLVQLGVIFVGVVAAAAPLVWLMTSLLNPVGLLIAGAAALSGAIALNFDGIRDKILATVEEVTGGLQPLKDAFDTFMTTLFPPEPDTSTAVTAGGAVGTAYVLEIGKTISAWDAYEDREKALEGLSWSEFQQWLVDNGWEGGALTEGMSFTFMAEGQARAMGVAAGDDIVLGFKDSMAVLSEGDVVEPKQLTMFDRLAAAVTAAWPKLEIALGTMWANFTNWVTTTAIPQLDALGGNVLNAIAGWFNTTSSDFSGQSGVYDAVTGVLTADVAGGVADASAGFAERFPQLSAGLSTLFDNMGKWILAEGIPTLARSVGFIAGRLAGLLGEAIGSVWSMITGGVDTSGATSVLETSVFDPLNEGIQEGIGVSGATNPFTIFFDNISAALLLAAGAWVIAPGIVSAIASPIIGAVGSAFTTAMANSALLSSIKNFVGMIGVSMSAAFGALSILAIGAVIIYGLLNDPGIQSGLAAWAGVWENFKTIVEFAVGKITTFIAGVGRSLRELGLDAAISFAKMNILINPNDLNTQRLLQDLDAQAQGIDVVYALEDALSGYLAGKNVNLDIGGLVWGLSGMANEEGVIPPEIFQQAIRDNLINPQLLQDAINLAIANDDQYELSLLLPIKAALVAGDNTEWSATYLINELMKGTGLTPEAAAEALRVYYADNPVMLENLDVAIQNIKLERYESDSEIFDTFLSDMDTLFSGGGGAGSVAATSAVSLPVAPELVTDNIAATTQTWADAVVNNLPTAVTTAVTNAGGNMDAAAQSMTAPFALAFTTAFGEGGSVATVWGTFLTGFVTDITTLQETVDTTMPLIESSIATTMTSIATSVDKAAVAIDKVARMLGGLDGQTITFTLSSVAGGGAVQGGGGGAATPVAGSFATGLDYVPYDGFVGEMHKGEMILPAAQAEDYRAGRTALPAVTQNTSVDSRSATFNFYETMTFDRFIGEAKRRGYKIDKYR